MPAGDGLCAACRLWRSLIGRGLCARCYDKPTLRGKHPPRRRQRRWTAAEYRRLARLAKSGRSWGEIAALMGRSRYSVVKAAGRRGTKSAYVPVRDRWNRFS